MAKEGSTISGLMDTLATLTSLSLQYGVPLAALVTKFSHVRYEPSGFTKNPDIPIAKSLTDYIFRFLGARFGQPVVTAGVESPDGESTAGRESGGVSTSNSTPAPLRVVPAARPTDTSTAGGGREEGGLEETSVDFILPQSDAPSCADCGAIMVRNGACYKCLNCGATSGCS
jgi:ribonucleoside-diphosphate reductase alpha chain